MGNSYYSSFRDCLIDLEKEKQLIRIVEEIDPNQELAAIHRRVHAQSGPALLFERVKGSPFPAVSNVFGTINRCRFLFRSTLETTKRLIELRASVGRFLTQPTRYWRTPAASLCALPLKVWGGPAVYGQTYLDRLPQVRTWPLDGGAFITLPQVYTENPNKLGVMNSNLGMYRIQISGNDYIQNKEVGLHYQIHRGIGVHHALAIEKGEPLKVSIFVGGPPAHTLAAIMPLPEGLTELTFAGLLAGRRFRYIRKDGYVISADADFCILGTIESCRTAPEGPFGDHLGYYSLKHEFPVMKVKEVHHRKDAVWPLTVVGRPPQEDSAFGSMIHELTGPMVPVSIPGVSALNAVDAAGVHPLLLAIGSERYQPYAKRRPQELLTIANSILGFGQCSLAKYLFLVAKEDNPDLNVQDVAAFFKHLLERVDWQTDLHFQTQTTMDTLDYTGGKLNSGSKLVIVGAGCRRRELSTSLHSDLSLPTNFHKAILALPGVAVVQGEAFSSYTQASNEIEELCSFLQGTRGTGLAMVVIADDAEFAARNLSNFLWVSFTRSNPSHDVYGLGAKVEFKHWSCSGPLIVDARLKPHHAPVLEEDPKVKKQIERFFKPNGPLCGFDL